MSSNNKVLAILDRARSDAEADANGDAAGHWRLLEEIHNLQLAVETPAERTMRMRFQYLQNLCSRMALEYGLLQAIAAKKRAKVTAGELANQSGVDEMLIVRIMRLVTYVGYCEEVGHAAYASNETTAVVTQRGYIGGEKHLTDLGFSIGSKLVEMIRGHGIHQFPEGPHQQNPFQYTFGMSVFEYLQHDQEQKEAFDAYMSVRRDANAPQWFETYPAEQELRPESLKQDRDAVLLADVGGNKGHEVANFKQRFPHLPGRLVNQDLPETIRYIDSKAEGVELMEHDFFTQQPVKGARIYYLRSILHDWSDENCRAILSNVVAAMDKDYSRVLIDDYVLPNTNAPVRAASMDILMLLYASGIERTELHWRMLLDSVGLEIVKVWVPKVGHESVIEATIKS